MTRYDYLLFSAFAIIGLFSCTGVSVHHRGMTNAEAVLNCSDDTDIPGGNTQQMSLSLNQSNVASVDVKMGYIDSQGKSVISAQFDYAGTFSEGLALVRVKNKFGYIDKSGKTAIPLKFAGGHDFSEGLAVVFINGKYGYIDRVGAAVIAPQYEEALDFYEGLAFVAKGGKFGVIGKSGEFIIPPRLTPFRSSDTDADQIAVFRALARTRDANLHFSQGLAALPVSNASGHKWGYIDSHGEIVIAPSFDQADDFSEGLARVRMGEKFGYIDQSGKVVIPVELEDCLIGCNFSEGLAPISVSGKRGYINKSGDIVIGLQYAGSLGFNEGIGIVTSANSSLIRRGGINRDGHWVFCPKYDIADRFFEGFAKIKVGDLFGFIDRNGVIAIPTTYVEAGRFSEGLAAVSFNSETSTH